MGEQLAPDDPQCPLDPRVYSRRTLLAIERTYLGEFAPLDRIATTVLSAGGSLLRWPRSR